MNARRIAIVGGGMLGMSLALRLARRGFAVTIFEHAAELGGLAAPWKLGAVTWDRHYHVMLSGDRELRALIDELGLGDRVHWKALRSAFYIDGAVHPFSTALDYLRFPALSLAEKLRLAATVAHARRERDGRALTAIGVEPWLRARGGDRVFERIWRPLLRAKLGDAYDTVAASFIWATIRRMYGTGAPQRFGYVEGGYRTVIEHLHALLERCGVRIELGTAVQTVAACDGELGLLAGEQIQRFDRVVLTTPAGIAARIAQALSQEERDRLRAIRYQGIVCASVLLDRPLGDAYVTNLADETIPFTGAIEMTALVDPRAFGGRHLIYLPRYADVNDSYYLAGDAELRIAASRALARLFPAYAPSHVRAFRVSRVPHVFALPTIGYAGRLPGFGTTQRGLYIATSAQIVDGTLNVNETLELARRAAEHIVADVHFSDAAVHEAAG